MNWKTARVLAACCAVLATASFAQAPPFVKLVVELENMVAYYLDVPDPLKRGLSATAVPPVYDPPKTYTESIGVADAVSVNGTPVKGIFTNRALLLNFSPNPASQGNITDLTVTGPHDCHIIIASESGRYIGTLHDGGLAGGGALHEVFSGSGAFLGVRGQKNSDTLTPLRYASAAEDPAKRRALGGGRMRFIFYLVPQFRPEILATPEGPAIFHADDFSQVTPEKPARAGEVLVARATNLGPTTPSVRPDVAFPAWPANPQAEVNSPVEVTVNDKAAEVLYKMGWPEQVRVYRVDFRVPPGTPAGMAAIRLTAAWIPGPEVKIPVR